MYFDFSRVSRTPKQEKLEKMQNKFFNPNQARKDERKWFTCVYEIEDEQGNAKKFTQDVLAYDTCHAYRLGQVYGSVRYIKE